MTYYSATAGRLPALAPAERPVGNHTLPGRMPERALFPGVMILLLAAVGLVPPLRRRRASRTPRALLVAFEMSRGFNSPFYPYLYEWLAFVRGLRVPARASVLVGMTLALFAAFGVRRLMAGRTPRLQQAALAMLVVAIAIDLRPLLRLEPVWLGAAADLRTRRRAPPDVVLAEFPFGGNPNRFTPNAPFMYFRSGTGRRC